MSSYGKKKLFSCSRFFLIFPKISRSSEKNVYLIYTHESADSSNRCVIHKLVGSHFDEVDSVPCENTQSIEFFEMFKNLFLFVGNSPSRNGQTTTKSYILKYDWNEKKFLVHQRISTNIVLDSKYFFLDNQPMRQHYLVIANKNEETTTVLFYKYVNEFFIPIQTIPRNEVVKVLPVMSEKQFYMLISSETQDVQIFEHNGWKFVESSIDFTGEVFGKGVSSVRAYSDIINGTTTIVIANREVAGNISNIYTPKFVKKNETSKFKMDLTEWCNEALQQIQEFDVEKTNERLGQSLMIMNEDIEEADFFGKLYLSNTTVDVVETKILESPSYVINNQTVERVQELSSRLDNMNKKISGINQKLKILKLQSNNRVKRQAPEDSLHFDSLVIDNILTIQKINGNPLSQLVYRDNSRNQITEIKANQAVVQKSLQVTGKIGGVAFSRQNLIFDNEDQEFFEASVPQITFESIDCRSKINSAPTAEFFQKLSKKFAVKLNNPLNELRTKELFIETIDNTDLQIVMEKALKINGDQVITGNLDIGRLTAKRVIFDKIDPVLSKTPLSNLVIITNPKESYIISQDIRFSNPVLSVNNLTIQNRVNNIQVKGGVLQVLKKRSPDTQIVSAEKFFDDVILMGPINLQGKIRSETLEKMNPTSTFNRNIQLSGDYKINGNVTIKRQLVGKTIIQSSNENFSLNKLLKHGIQIKNISEINSKFVFKQPIHVQNNLDATTINGLKVNSFVKTETEDVQYIFARKYFPNDLIVVGGQCEANNINGIDILRLNNTVLKQKTNGPQIVNGSIEFNKVAVAK